MIPLYFYSLNIVTGIITNEFIYNNELNYVDEGFYNQQKQHLQQRHSLQEKNQTHFESILYDNKKYTKRSSLPVKLNDSNLQEIFNNNISNNDDNNNNKNNNKRLSSLTNLSQRLSLFNSQYTPYLFRKLSMSKVKVRN